MTHVKPTKEELQAQIDKAAKEAEENLSPSLSASPSPSPSESASASPSASASASASASPSPSEEVPDDSKPPKKPERTDDPDLKKRLSESSKENQKIIAKNRKLNQAIDEGAEMPDPTKEELQTEYDDFDEMTATEQRLAKEVLISKRFREKISKAREEGKRIEKWGEQVDAYLEDPKNLTDNPDLEGKEDDFREYANSEENNSVPFRILVGAFLHDQSKKTKPNNKGKKMFEKGTGGSNEKPVRKTDVLTVEEGARLRDKNYKEYKRLLIAGKIAKPDGK